MKARTIEIFNSVYKKLESFHELFMTRTPVIAFSGGKDSTILLHFYLYLAQENKSMTPVLYHLDHSIRNNEEQEEKIADCMNSIGVPVYIKKKNIPELANAQGKSLEEMGREERYNDLLEIAACNNGYIVTGHHVMDYLESVLIHLIRGGGPAAMSTLKPFTQNLFRPLVYLEVEEFHELLQFEVWKIFTDESNNDFDFLRNRIRNTIIPALIHEGLDPYKMYHNFHDEPLLYHFYPRRKKSFMRINQEILEEIEIHELKKLLDVYASRLSLSPFNRSFLSELFRQLQSGGVVALKNAQLEVYKSPRGSLYLIPMDSSLLRGYEIIKEGAFRILSWHDKTFEIPQNMDVGNVSQYKRIIIRGCHREITEIFREKEIPPSVRNHVPILAQNEKVKVILLSLYDIGLKDIKADPDHE